MAIMKLYRCAPFSALHHLVHVFQLVCPSCVLALQAAHLYPRCCHIRQSLQADHDRYKHDTSARIDELAAHVTYEVDACRDKLERELATVQGDLVAKCKAVESMCQVLPLKSSSPC